jgi:hypothetical protein
MHFLELDQPITLHLETLLTPTRDVLAALGMRAYYQTRSADAVVLVDAAIELNIDQPDATL